MRYLLPLLIFLTGCLTVPVEDVGSRKMIVTWKIDLCLRDYGVPDDIRDEIHYDKPFYRHYTLDEMEQMLADTGFIREFEYHNLWRSCAEFAEVFEATARIMMPAVPIATIEYKNAITKIGHKLCLWFYYKDGEEELTAMMVEPRGKTGSIREFSMEGIIVREINMAPGVIL